MKPISVMSGHHKHLHTTLVSWFEFYLLFIGFGFCCLFLSNFGASDVLACAFLIQGSSCKL